MKKTVLLLVATLWLLNACTWVQKPSVPEGEFLIEGRLKNIPEGTLLALWADNGRRLYCIDTDTLTNGKFTFRDTASVARIVRLDLSQNKGYPDVKLDVWVSPGEYVQITGKDQIVRTWQIKSNISEQLEENNYRKCIEQEEAQIMQYLMEDKELILQLMDENTSKEQIKAKRDSLQKLKKKQEALMEQKVIEYMKKAPVTPLWIDKLYTYSQASIRYDFCEELKEELKTLSQRMNQRECQTRKGRWAKEYLGWSGLIGKEMMDGDLYDMEDNIRHLAELKGQYILLDFWRTDCGPCVKAIPELEELGELYKDTLAVISISLDDRRTWKTFVKKKQMKGYQWNGLRSKLSEAYQTNGIPHFVLINPEGKIQSIWGGYGEGGLKYKLQEEFK